MLTNLNDTQLYEEYNKLTTFELCFNSQELVQDLVSKTSDFVTSVKHLSSTLIYGDQNINSQRKSKIDLLLKTFESIFQRLRIISSILNQRKLELIHTKQETENNLNGQIQTRLEELKSEKEQLIEQIRFKNRYIKQAIDRVSDIIWQINSIQTLKQ